MAPEGPPPEHGAPSPRGGVFAAGERIAGRYEVRRLIAVGGMGEVYEALDRELEVPVALKVVLPEVIAADGLAAERFRREIHMARAVTHPNVCRVFDVGRHHVAGDQLGGGPRDILFLTMELLAGETLADLLLRRHRLPPQEALPLVRQMAAALHAAHRAQVIHRDFKTGNVILVPASGAAGKERVVVTDFGLARRPDAVAGQVSESAIALTAGRGAMGTPAYVSPEQLRGKPVTPRADIYSFGVVLYELVTGRRPFQGDNPSDVALRRLSDPPVPPRRHVPSLDPRWERVILRCLEREPEERYGDVLEAVADLERPRLGALRPWLHSAVALALTVLGVVLLERRASDLAAPQLRPLQAPAPVGSPVQLTTDPGLEIDPAYSPDGRALAYSADRTGRFEIWVRLLDPTAAERQLTRDEQANFQPAWSPDGRSIAYYSQGRGGLWLLPAQLDGAPRRLTSFGSQPPWSPDGRRIVFQSDAWPRVAASALPAMPPSVLWAVEVDGGRLEQLTRVDRPRGGHGMPSWSPDGRSIAFTASDRLGSDAWLLELASGTLAHLSEGLGNVFHPVYASGGGSIFCSAFPGGPAGSGSGQTFGLWHIPLRDGRRAGDASLLASPGLASVRELTVHPHGRDVAFSARSMQSNIWTVALTADGRRARGEPRPLTRGTGRNNRPAFSPDGSRLAIERWQVGINADIWAVDVGGGEPAQLTFDAAYDSQPSWLPAGDRIAFRTNRRGANELWTVRLDDAREEPLAALPADADWALLAPDGRRLVYHSRRGGHVTNVWIRDLDGGADRQLTFDEELLGFPVVAPDGRHLAAQIKRGEHTNLVVVPLAGGEPVQLTSDPGHSWAYSWAPDSDRILFAAFRDGIWNLRWVSRRTREEVQITAFEDRQSYVRYPAWSPRGDLVAFERAENTGDVWVLRLE